jgi:uncharacterized membrane protein (DUF106 family)
MSTNWKVAVSIGVPAIIYGLFIIDCSKNGAKITAWVVEAIRKWFAVLQGSHNPYLSILTTGLVTIVFTLVNYCMIRKTVLK